MGIGGPGAVLYYLSVFFREQRGFTHDPAVEQQKHAWNHAECFTAIHGHVNNPSSNIFNLPVRLD